MRGWSLLRGGGGQVLRPRRWLGLALAVGLVLGVLPVGPPGVVGQSATITLSFDDGQGTPSAVTGVAEEGGGQSVRVVATASAATSAVVAVNVTAAAGTATATTDYAISAASWTVTIASGATVGRSAALTVTPVADALVEGDETIVFSATTTATGYSAIADVSLNIEDADVITLSFDDGQSTPSAVTGVSEEGGGQSVRVVATASAATSAAVTVNVTAAAGTATATTDYAISAASWTVTIASGATVGRSAALTVTPASDMLVEGDETIVFSATTTATGYAAIGSVNLSIGDDDNVITLSFDDGQGTPSALTGVPEGGGGRSVRVVATASAASGVELTVNVSAAAGTAADPEDYGISASSTSVTIASGDTVGYSEVLTVTPVDDLSVEGDETIVFSGSTTVPGHAAIADVSLNIVDDDNVITLSFADAAGQPVDGLGEDGGRQSVRLVASVPAGVLVPADVDVSVTVDDAPETATPGAGGDYTASGIPASLTVSISSGGTVSGSSGDLVFTALSDRVLEDHEIVRRFTGTASGYTVKDADLLILDADRTIVVTMDNLRQPTTHHFFTRDDGTFVLRETGDPRSGPIFCSCHDGPQPWFTGRVDGVTSSTYSQNLTMYFKLFSGTAEVVSGGEIPGTVDITGLILDDWFRRSRTHNVRATLNAGNTFFRFRPGGSQADFFSGYNFIAEPDETFTIGFAKTWNGFEPPDGFEIVPVQGVVIDDDVQLERFWVDVTSVAEGSPTDVKIGTGFNASLTDYGSVPSDQNREGRNNAQRSELTSDTVVSLSVVEGPGLLSADEYSATWTRRSITIAAGAAGDGGWETTLTNLSVADDGVVEGLERLRIVGTAALAATKSDGSPTDQVVTFKDLSANIITVTDANADITLSVSPGTVSETAAGQPVTVSAEFAGSSSVLTSDTDVAVQIAGGTATLTSDFTTGLANDRLTVTIPAGETRGSKSFTLTAIDDSTQEPSGETVTFAGHGTTRVGGQTVTVTGGELTIMDPGSEVVLSLTDTGASPAVLSAVGEDGGAEMVRVTATVGTAPSGSDLDVAVTVGALGSTADAGDDYTLSGSSVTVTIADGATSGSADVTVTPVPDTVTEDHETIWFTGTATGYVVAPVSLEITDADRTVTLEFAVSGSYPLEFREGRYGNEWRSITAHVEGVSSTYSGSIEGRVRPESGTAVVDATGQSSGDLYNWLESSNTGDHKHVSIGAGATSSGPAWFNSRVRADDAAEPVEDLFYTLSDLTDGFTVERVRVTLVDPLDTAVVLTLGGTGGTVSEGGDLSGLSVTAGFPSGVTSNALGSDLVVTLGAPEAGTAGADDFSWTPPDPADTLTIPTTATVSPDADAVSPAGVSITDDSVVENPETLQLTGSYTLDGETRETSAELTIEDDDANVVLSVSPGTVAEGDTEEVRVTARFAGSATELTSDTTVTVTIAAGTATLTTDFTTDATGSQVSVVIPAGSLSGSATFNLTAETDSTMEGNETVALSGAGTIGSQTLMVTGAAVNIVDSGITLAVDADAGPSGASGVQSSVGEEGGTKMVEVTVTLPTAPSGSAEVVGLNVVGGTAVLDDDSEFGVGEDFRVTYPSPQSPAPPAGHSLAVEVADGATTGSATFTVVLDDDDVAEGSAAETVVIEGAAVTYGGGTYEVVSTSFGITDDDASPTTIGLSLLDSEGEDLTEVREDGGTVRVRVKAALAGEKVLPRSVTVPLTVGMSGGALAVHDFKRVSSLAVTIPPYEDEGTVEFDLELIDDTRPEGAEELTVHAGTLGAGLTGLGFTAVESDSLTIVDNDMILGLLDAEGEPLTRVLEGASPQVQVQLSYPGIHWSSPRFVRVTVEAGTAAGSDYRIPVAPGDVFFPPGQNSATKTIGLNTVNDRSVEGDETLRVSAAAEGFDIAPVELIIQDNEIRLSLNQASVREDAGRITRTVTAAASSAPPEDLVVNVRVAGSGYTSLSPRSFSITIPAGETSGSRSFSMTVTDDSTPGNSKSVSVTGSASGFDVSSARLTITDDGDTAPPPPPPPAGGGGGGGGGGGAPPPSGGGGGGGGAPPPAGGGGGGGGGAPPPAGGGAQPPAQPPAPACVGRFCDDDGNVHQDNIERIAVWRITLGCDAQDATKYCPDAEITRRQMSAFLHRAVSQRWTIEAPEGIELSDVGADEWFRPFAEWVVSVGAFSAPGGVFDPGGVVTRADMAIMMIGAFPHLDAVPTEASRFGDVEGLSPEVLAALEGMYQTGVTRGCSAEPLNYCPAQPVTRAQMASFFVRAVNLAPADTQPAAGT